MNHGKSFMDKLLSLPVDVKRFLFYTFAWSWITWFLAITLYSGIQSTPGSILYVLGAIAPSSVGLIQAKKKGTQYWRDFKKRVLSIDGITSGNLIFIFGFVPTLLIVSYLFSYLSGTGLPELNILWRYLSQPFNLGLFVLLTFIGGPLMEEFGWRGYCMDQLRKSYGLFFSTLLLALIWAVWHLPLFLLEGTIQSMLIGISLVSFFWYNIEVLSYGIVFGYILSRNEYSVLSAILFHFSINFFTGLTQFSGSSRGIYAFSLMVSSLLVARLIRKQ
ncbi:CPBP family intramembrane metalloprotease [Candidatus Bathyarchaeota archaeon]|nr:CPBP family intramembrane metalloprotease [Candidatus Bathyarchaeota archaeon]